MNTTSIRKRIIHLGGALLLSIVAALPAVAKPALGSFVEAKNKVPGQYIVVLRDDVAAAGVDNLAKSLASAHGGSPRRVFKHALKGFSVSLSEAAARALAKNPHVAYVEENGVFEASDVQNGAPWGLDRIDQRYGTDGAYHYGLTGEGVHVYVIDTGVRVTHAEFEGRASIGFDAIGDGLNGNDGNGHGTHVAGTIAGHTYGVAKRATIHAVRVLDSTGHGSTENVVDGINWVTANHASPAVANMSLGGGASPAMDDAVRNSIASGVVYAVAAGNFNTDASSQSPARVSEAITVGAVDSSDTRASFSNYGSVLDVFAPGVDVLSSSNGSDSATAVLSGTSMATPHVAGLVALYLQASPGSSPAQVESAIRNNATAAVINPGPGSPNALAFDAVVAPSASLSAGQIALGQSITFNRDGYCSNGFAWSEATLWHPGGGYTVLGSVGQNPYAQTFTPSAGAGTYWIQFRLVDSAISFQDQWISFTVTAAGPTPNGYVTQSTISYGQSTTFVRDGSTPGGFGWSEAVLWNTNGTYSILGVANQNPYSETITPATGPGTYWIQFRLVDAQQNFADQWIPLYVQ